MVRSWGVALPFEYIRERTAGGPRLAPREIARFQFMSNSDVHKISADENVAMKRRVVFAATVAAIAVATLLVFVLVPVPQHFAMRNVSVSDDEVGCTGILTSRGTTVSFQWSAPSYISFGAWSCSANWIVYWGNGTNGSDSFVSQGGVYEFGAICGYGTCVVANVSGSYTGPLLQL
jgi:hypothetical protein